MIGNEQYKNVCFQVLRPNVTVCLKQSTGNWKVMKFSNGFVVDCS